MPTIPQPYRELLQHYARGPALVREAIDGLEPGALNRRPLGSDWSIRDVLMHLTDAELMAATRFRLVIAEDNPPLQPWDQEHFKRRLHYLWRDPEASLALHQMTVFTNAELLQQCDAKTWERAGEHPTRGALTLGDLLRSCAEHLDTHLEQIRSYRSA